MMQAARLHGYEQDFVVEEIADPEPGPGQVLVRIGASGACHSDLHVRSGAMAAMPFPPFPWTLGHENAGWVEALGAGAEGFEVGEPVAVFGGWGCGLCRVCLGGEEQLCDVMRWGGIGRPGGYAELLVVPSTRHLVRLAALDPVDAAALTDAGLTPYRAVKKVLGRLVPGTTVVSIGVGGLGHFGLQLLKELSPAKVIAVDTEEAKRDLAADLGADLVVDPLAGGAVTEITSFTGGNGADVVLDFVGADDTLGLAARAVGRKGTIVLLGLAGGAVPFSFFGLPTEAELTTSSWGSRNELAEVIALADQGRLHGHVERHPLKAINAVFERLEHGTIEGRAVLMP
ncbi:MAG TPA: NAD(P)-dependent alcohol dehydrogenase [Acidimicrobiia bacterium]|nr:NAD(P)-dependent alcohol dehydrogenase [Acidimicrobiia bacterium]